MLGLAVARVLLVHLRAWYHSVLGSEAVIFDHHSYHSIACSMRDESLKQWPHFTLQNYLLYMLHTF